MFCSKCGEQLNESAVFCYKCGAKVESNVSNDSQQTEQAGHSPEAQEVQPVSEVTNNVSNDGQQTDQASHSPVTQPVAGVIKKNKLLSLRVLSIIGFVLFPLCLFLLSLSYIILSIMIGDPNADYDSFVFLFPLFLLLYPFTYLYSVAYSITALVKGVKYNLKTTQVMSIIGIILWFVLSLSTVVMIPIIGELNYNNELIYEQQLKDLFSGLWIFHILGMAYAIAFSIVVFLQSRKKSANTISGNSRQTDNLSKVQTVNKISKRKFKLPSLPSLNISSIINFITKNKVLFIVSLFLFLCVLFSVIYFIKLQTTIIFQETQLARLLGNPHASNTNANTSILSKNNDELDAQVGYSIVQRTIDSSLISVQRSNDYEENIIICDNVISAINEFIISSNDIYLNNMAEISRSEWYSMKIEFQSSLDSLTDDLHKKLDEKASSIASERHPFSNIENIVLLNSRKTKDENLIYYERFYDVRMVGSFLGSSIYKFTILVNGYIDMSNDSTRVSDKFIVDE